MSGIRAEGVTFGKSIIRVLFHYTYSYNQNELFHTVDFLLRRPYALCYTWCAMASTEFPDQTEKNTISNRQWHAGVIVLVLFILAKSLVWAFVNPPLNVGDESAHLAYIMQVRNGVPLPVFM